MRTLKDMGIKISFSYPLLVMFAVLFLSMTFMTGCAVKKNPEYEKLMDRIKIEDMLVEYYVDLVAKKYDDLAKYYTEDAIFDASGIVAKGREEIEKLYSGLDDGDPADLAYWGYYLLNNPIINVEGDTATAWTIWTSVVNEDIKKPPRLLAQGREYDELVKIDGRWYIQKRYITFDSGITEIWEKNYKPRRFR